MYMNSPHGTRWAVHAGAHRAAGGRPWLYVRVEQCTWQGRRCTRGARGGAAIDTVLCADEAPQTRSAVFLPPTPPFVTYFFDDDLRSTTLDAPLRGRAATSPDYSRK